MKQEEWGKNLEQLFSAIGLSKKESKVYRVLLEAGALPAGEIIGKARLKRGITYAVLYNLERDGLVSQVKKGKKTVFRPESPHKLLELLEAKKTQVDTIHTNLKEILPKLSSQYKLTVGKPTVKYFEGREGLMAVLNDAYDSTDKELWGCVDIERSEKALSHYILPNLMPKRIKHGMFAYSISANSEFAETLAIHDTEHLREQILVDRDKYPLPAEIEIYDDKVAFVSFRNDDVIGVIITNQDFADSLRSICRLGLDLGRSHARKHGSHYHAP